jgi:photosystem II stability/assembly factor-like uncharacterized protein
MSWARMRWPVRLLLGLLFCAVGGSRDAHAEGETLQCLTLRAPCQSIDTVDVMLPAPVPGRAAPVPALVANFGLLSRDGAGRIRYACEPALGGLAVRARMSPNGEIFVPTDAGLLHYRPGCGAQPAQGDLAGRLVLGVIFDPLDPMRVWALGIGGASTLYLSRDGGDRFETATVLPAGLPIWQMKGAPSHPDTLFGVGERPPGGQLLLVRSDDGGRSFADVGAAPGAIPLTGLPLELLGIDPTNPAILFVAMRDASNADAVWRSRDRGKTWQRSLVLPVEEIMGGFALGADGRRVFVGGRTQLYLPGQAPAHLYSSADGGDTWQALPSGEGGPRFRCLAAQGDRLFACAGGETNGDAFLLGTSADGGKTWTPEITTAEIAGPEACMADSCAATSAWLCETYRICGAGDAGTPLDSAASDAPASPATGDGCTCNLSRARARAGDRHRPTGWPVPITVGLVAWFARGRRFRRAALFSSDGFSRGKASQGLPLQLEPELR